MPRLIVITLQGEELPLHVDPGQTLMESLRSWGVEGMLALCGGCCSCATCHVHIDPAYAERLPAASADERDLLDSCSHRRDHSRLACQIPVGDHLDGMRVTIAPEE